MSDIVEIVGAAKDQCDSHHREVQSMEDFIAKAETLLQEEAPEFVDKFKEIAGLMTQSLGCDKTIAGAEERLMEDFNDIKARFEVLFRTTDETGDAKQKLREARHRISKLRQDLEQDEAKGGRRKFKIEADIQAALAMKRQEIENCDKMFHELMSTRDRYNRFKVRRLRNAYANLGRKISESSMEQQEILGKLQKCISEAREGVDLMLDGQTLPETQYDEPAPTQQPEQPVYDPPYAESPFQQQPTAYDYQQPYETPAYNYTGTYGQTPFD